MDNDKTEMASEPYEKPFFSAVLTPYRSLEPKGFMILMICISLVSFLSGIFFLSIGAWPVFGFFGLDVLLIWWAFRMNYASARRYEEVILSTHDLLVRKVGPGEHLNEYHFNPLWVKVQLEQSEDEGVTRLSLFSHGKKTEIGSFLNPDDRTDFASAFSAALGQAKKGFNWSHV